VHTVFRRYLCALLILISIGLLNGCSLFISSATEDFGNHLQHAMLNSDDPETVAAAIPTLLLIQEAMLDGAPDDVAQLRATSQLHASYASLLPESEKSRQKRLHEKALNLALHAVCLQNDSLCYLQEKSFDEFTAAIKASCDEDLTGIYQLGKAWAGWIQTHKSDWHAVAQLAQVKFLMSYVVKQDPLLKQGEPYLYLGVLESILPPALGGKPDVAKQHFDQARTLSQNKNLMVNVLYAQHYARMMFDRELHDELLTAVIDASPQQEGLTLINTLAQRQAAILLQTADDYF
jgi:TRAP transporter TatT component family protein